MLNTHLKTLHEIFYTGNDIATSPYLQDKKSLAEALNEKELLRKDWEMLIFRIPFKSKYSVRDFTDVSSRHSFCLLFSYKNLNDESCGILLSLSVPFRLIGYYYYQYISISKNEVERKESYFPLELEMKRMEEKITYQVLNVFIDFNIFDAHLATTKIDQVLVDEKVFKNIDLWKVIFTENLSILM